MKLYDTNTQDLAQAVQDVLEGKKVVKEMDPAKHVEFNKETEMYCVYNKDGKKVKEFKSKEEAEKYAADNHDALMDNVAGPADLSVDQNMKKVKDKHGPVDKVDKTGLKEDIDAAHDEALAIEEARKAAEDKDEDEEGDEEPPTENSDKQKKYKAFFDKALKKFGVDSPSELKGDKKKEFFDYVDANYEADNEAD